MQRKFDSYLQTENFRRRKEYIAAEDVEQKLLGEDDGNDNRQRMIKKTTWAVVLEQYARGFIHTLQFAISYCIMLLFMYCNGIVTVHSPLT
jgi:copper transporter 1